MAKKNVELWERQKGERKKPFLLFQNYYLKLPKSERTLARAYRDYLREVNSNIPDGFSEEVIAQKLAPGSWQKWFRGHNGNSEALPRWDERAEAYDAWRESVLDEVKRETRFDLWSKEVEHYKQLLLTWNDIYLLLAAEARKDEDERRGISFLTGELKKLVSTRKEISEFVRNTVDLPSQIREERVVQVQYNEPPLVDKDGKLDLGYGAEDVEELDEYDQIVERLSNGRGN